MLNYDNMIGNVRFSCANTINIGFHSKKKQQGELLERESTCLALTLFLHLVNLYTKNQGQLCHFLLELQFNTFYSSIAVIH